MSANRQSSQLCKVCCQFTLSGIRKLPSISLKLNFYGLDLAERLRTILERPPIILFTAEIEPEHVPCPICHLIRQELAKHAEQPAEYIEVYKCEDLNDGIETLYLYLESEKKHFLKFTLFADHGAYTGWLARSSFQANLSSQEPGSFASKYLPFRPFARSDADESIQTMNNWLLTCDKEHSRCCYSISGAKMRAKARLPTRVIDVGSSGGAVRLFIPNKIIARYVALSHCWGGHSQRRTTKATLGDHKDAIKIVDLSKTIQDAIEVARRLGVRYLWVDSLCIVQDDAEDWLRESGRMASVYEGAYVTIAASASADGSGGCFVSPETQGLVQIPCETDDTSAGHMYIGVMEQDAAEKMFYGPLNSRAWVLQEQLFSRRIIHFAKDQIYWECDKFLLGQDNSANNRSHLEITVPTRPLLVCILGDFLGPIRMPHLIKIPPQEPFNKADYYSWWFNLVKFFSKCGITKTSDKLPALLSLSLELEKLTNDEYHEGHWLGQEGPHIFISSLLWHPNDKKYLQAPTHFRAPSWSWAALDGNLDFADMIHTTVVRFFHPEETDLRILKIQMYQPIGFPKRKSLLLSAVLIRALVINNTSESQRKIPGKCMVCDKFKNKSNTRMMDEHEDEIIGRFTFDRADVQPESLWMLPTHSRHVDRDREAPIYFVLLVSEVSGQRAPGTVFERIGVGHIEDARVVYGRKRQFLVLV